jgi:hypothetical protein
MSYQIKKGIAPDGTEILGQTFDAFNLSISQEEIRPHFDAVLKRYGIAEIDPEAWYPLQLMFDSYQEVQDGTGDSLILVSVGMKVIEAANLPDEIDSIASGIQLLMDIHHANLRNVPDGDGYANLDVQEGQIQFDDYTRFPHDVIYGYIYGMAQRFRPQGKHVKVQREYHNVDSPNNGGAYYTITW